MTPASASKVNGIEATSHTRHRQRRRFRAPAWIAGLALLASAGFPQTSADGPATLPPPRKGLLAVPLPGLQTLENTVAEQIRSLQAAFADTVAKPSVSASDLAQSYGTLGQLYHAYELVEAAQACYLNAGRLAPKDHRWLHLLGQLSRQQGDLAKTVSYFTSAQEANPSYGATAVRLGNAYLQLDRPGEARREFEVALKADGASPAAQSGLGEVALAQQRYADAVKYFEAALKQVPQANRMHYSLGMAYRGMGDLEKARSHLKQRGPVGVRPKDPLVEGLEDFLRGERVHLLQGRLAFSAGGFQEAARAFAEAVRAKPDSERARTNLGTALGRLGRSEAAAQQFREVLRLNPRNPTAHFNLGALTMRDGEPATAVQHFEAVLDTNPRDSEALRELAKALIKLGRNDEALQYLPAVVEKFPEDEGPLVALAELWVTREQYQQARDLLDKAHRKFPGRGRTAHALARLLAACPKATLRDGPRALDLAAKVYNSTRRVVHGETVALALAQTGHCEDAAEMQKRLIAAADKANEAKPGPSFAAIPVSTRDLLRTAPRQEKMGWRPWEAPLIATEPPGRHFEQAQPYRISVSSIRGGKLVPPFLGSSCSVISFWADGPSGPNAPVALSSTCPHRNIVNRRL